MEDISAQKKNLEQKKARLARQEMLLKIKERKNRTRRLIELGGLIAKAKIDHLPSNTLLGALLSIKEAISNTPALLDQWEKRGSQIFAKDENSKTKTPVIVQLAEKPSLEIRTILRNSGLKWNSLRKEWSGYVYGIDDLKAHLRNVDFALTIVED